MSRITNPRRRSQPTTMATKTDSRTCRLLAAAASILGAALLATPVRGRVAGKVVVYSSNYGGLLGHATTSKSRSTSGINEEIIWVSIGMGITIAVLITLALCYILREKCQKRRGVLAAGAAAAAGAGGGGAAAATNGYASGAGFHLGAASDYCASA